MFRTCFKKETFAVSKSDLIITYQDQRKTNSWFFFFRLYLQKRNQRCSTGPVGIEDSADGSAMPRSISSVTMVALEDTGRPSNEI